MERTTVSLLLAILLAAGLLVALGTARARPAPGPTGTTLESEGPGPRPAPLLPSLRSEPLLERAGRAVPARGAPPTARAALDAPGNDSRIERWIEGWVVDPDGRPVPEARVTPWRTLGTARSRQPEDSTVTEANGRFELQGARRGATALVVEHPRFLTWEGAGGSETPLVIELATPLEARLRVVDCRGRAAVRSTVRFRAPGPREAWREIEVDASGRLRLTGLRPGSLSVWVEGPSGSLGPALVPVGAAEDVLLQLPETQPLEVTVLASDGTPLEQARVVLLPPGERTALQSVPTDADGRASFPAAPAAPLRVLAEHPAALFACRPVAQGEREVVLRAEPSGSLLLRSSAFQDLLIELRPDADPTNESRRLVVRKGRDLRCAPLATGAWTARASALPAARGVEGLAARGVPLGAVARFEIQADQQASVQLETARAATLHAELAWPLEGIVALEVAALPASPIEAGLALVRAPFGPAIPACFEGLPAGDYTLTLCAEGGGRWQHPRPLRLEPGEERRVRLAPIASSAVVVARAGGTALRSACARLADADGGLGAGTISDGARILERTPRGPPAGADDAGRIRLELWPGGHRTVVVEAPGFDAVEVELGDQEVAIDLEQGGT